MKINKIISLIIFFYSTCFGLRAESSKYRFNTFFRNWDIIKNKKWEKNLVCNYYNSKKNKAAFFFLKCDTDLQDGNIIYLLFYYNNKNTHDKFLILGLYNHDQFRVYNKIDIKNSKITLRSAQYKFNQKDRKEISLNKDVSRQAILSSTKINKIRIKISSKNTISISLNNIKLPVSKLTGNFSKLNSIVIGANSSDFLINRFSIYKGSNKLTSIRFNNTDKIEIFIINIDEVIEDITGAGGL